MNEHHCHNQPDAYLAVRHLRNAEAGHVDLEFETDDDDALTPDGVVLDPDGRAALATDLLTDHPTHTVVTHAALAATAERARKAQTAMELMRATLQKLHRQITTVDELRALPEHAVIVDDNGGAQQKTRGGFWLDYVSRTGFCTAHDVDLPATLVWLLPTPAEQAASEPWLDRARQDAERIGRALALLDSDVES